ncbi:2-dehydropantoate 2-reductase [Bacillus paranthracis]|uniref:2-dehydropantoate 2-reductase n=1 Tax=Bacillus cereus group TaxID=86661 RepID=UPI000C34F23B|nr:MULTISPECIES: 2-dehydropantoate 2-reductase [Bacillus cereus group]MBL3844401.1 2-dehydropantoate 2-reductase [Bacillus cereus]MDA1590646.1 2-dehydropantoate 2-reductase [Bacillus cereus group sp. TH225LC]MDA1890625.1 2-dehydropantoate 2-reductase [Bacillus cereus group sp. BY11-1LC]MDA2590570.1 2-dehydropantoate 2-reductase [Bacillus cereus group sp. Bc065]MDK7438802.1 2-dehydropantoate 2-reductase [Bacillus paranthracis]
MRILVLGAGGVGGFFGGRLVEKGEDVTFLVRSKRKKQLEERGLVIRSVNGDFSFQPKLITKEDQTAPFDVILFSTKAYHLNEAIQDLKPFVGESTVIIPLLNGIAHVSLLQKEFGEEKVIGGLCFIETTLNNQGEIVQTSAANRLMFGEMKSQDSERIQHISKAFAGTKSSFILSENITQDMWHKYLFITVMSGVTTLMRAPIGPIRESEGGRDFIQNLFEECMEIMRCVGAPIKDNIVQEHMKIIDKISYNMKSSMQRDMEKGSSIEAKHLQGYLLDVAEQFSIEAPLLGAVYQNLKVYEEMTFNKSAIQLDV